MSGFGQGLGKRVTQCRTARDFSHSMLDFAIRVLQPFPSQ